MKKLFCYFTLLLITPAVITLAGCHKKSNNIQIKTMTVQEKPLQQSLYFSGVIEPLSKQPVISPVKGVVIKKFFEYGEPVKKGQLLFTLSSTMQQDTFQSALTDFLKAKQALNSSQDKMKSTVALYKQEIVSEDDYNTDKTTYYLDQLTYTQAKNKLDEILKYHHIDNLSSLSISDTATINRILKSNQQSSTINITAPYSGVALFSNEDASSTTDSRADIGSSVKDGELLLYIGDVSGISSTIQINEININQIQEKQKAEITSIAFPNITLHGYIQTIDTQAADNNNLPAFTAKIIVPKLSEKEKNSIHIGMSTKIQLIPNSENKIMIPISAVTQQGDDNLVTVIDKQSGGHKNVPVTTGQTTLNEVVITSGLKPGDEIVVSH